ncbi:MAG: hypothetical protein EBY29_15620, partial [Planctomycetes bacterium]|nr:hypothetical protein [Planctomycetota bacterium]
LSASGDAQELAVRLEVVTGSAAEAAKVMQKVRDVAGPSPFTTKQLANAAVGLQAMGISATKALPKLADLGAAFGADEEHLKSLVNMMGKLNQGIMPDSETLSMFGLGKKDFAGEGITFDKNGTLLSSASQTLDALFRIIDKKYGGMTERMSKNTNSQLATIVDSFEKMSISIGNIFGAGLSIVTPHIIKGLEDITKFFDSVSDRGSAAQYILMGLAASMAAITAVKVVDGVIMLIKVMKGLANALKAIAAGEAFIQALSGPAGIAKVVAGTVAAGAAIYGMSRIYDEMEKSAEKTGGAGPALTPPTTTDIGTKAGEAAKVGSTTENKGGGGLIGTMVDIAAYAARMQLAFVDMAKSMEGHLYEIAKNTGSTRDLLDLRKQTFGGGRLGAIGVTAAELNAGNNPTNTGGVGIIPQTLIPASTDLERAMRK